MLKIAAARPEDAGMARARLSPFDLNSYSLLDGGLIELEGERKSAFRMVYDPSIEEGCVGLDPVGMRNVGREKGGDVRFYKAAQVYAERVVLCPPAATPDDLDRGFIRARLRELPVNAGDEVFMLSPYGREIRLIVLETFPAGTVVITASTEIRIEKARLSGLSKKITYADIGGLDAQLRRIREMIEIPLKFPEAFVHFGVEPPKGVLLYGPPGTGKTVIAKAVANESDAWFTSISGPEIIGKYYGESEERLRAVFEEAQQNAPAIIFIDEVDAIAPKREEMGGEKQVERRVVAQLLTLMDGLSSRGQVVVIAATNIPNTLDPALRRPGRFDREIAIPIPDRNGRLEILRIHTRGMPLADGVDLGRLADVTHGFVGADLQALARESAMMALRRLLPSADMRGWAADVGFEDMKITMADFLAALREIEASAIREVFVEVPDTTWNDVGGMKEIKEQLIEAVQWPLKRNELFRRWGVSPPRGIMIHGRPGTGKTLLVKALAHESGVNFISVKGPSLLSRYVGESERAIREVFRTARQAAPCILYFDEIDSLVPVRGSDDSVQGQTTDRVISQFLTEMSGVEEMGDVVVVATTSRIDRVDTALFSAGRFEMVLELPLPDVSAREEILAICLRKIPLQGVGVDELARLTDGMNGAEIAELCRTASMSALREQIVEGTETPPRLLPCHFDEALQICRGRRDFLKRAGAKSG